MALLQLLFTIVLVALISWFLGMLPGVDGRFKQIINAIGLIVVVLVVLSWILGIFGIIAPIRLF